MKTFKQIIFTATALLCGAAGVFLLTGVGSTGMKIWIWLFFIVTLLNVVVYLIDYLSAKGLDKKVQAAAGADKKMP